MFLEASNYGTNAAYKRQKTSSGIKDNFLEYFVSKLHTIRGTGALREEAYARALEEIPSFPYSPIWRVKGILLFQLYVSMTNELLRARSAPRYTC